MVSVQEGAKQSALVQEGGMMTRSRSTSPSLPTIAASMSTLRRSVRRGRREIDYVEDKPKHVNMNTSTYRSLQASKKGRHKVTTWVAIAKSTIPNAGYGLFATQNLLEGTHPCTYGTCRVDGLNHISHYDTVYDDGHYISIGDRNKDYGCWCNDPLDQTLVNCIIDHDGAQQHRLKIRWDVTAGEELFLEYGEDYWKEHYWSNPTGVSKRYPLLIPNHPAPAEGESHRPRSNTVDVLKIPKNFEQSNTRPWTAPQSKKRSSTLSSEGGERIARMICSRYALEKLASMGEYDSKEDQIAYNIRNLQAQMQPFRKGRKRAKVQFKDDVDRMMELKAKQKKAKSAKSKRGIKRDNPTEKQARLRPDWPKFEEAIKAEMHQIRNEEKAHESKAVSHADLPKGANVIGSMMILSVKRKPDGTIDKYKARLVMLGNLQKGASYDQIKAGTVRNSTVKLLISLQAKIKGVSMVLDIKGAYLKSAIADPEKEKLYIRYPDGRIYKLLKYVYGLKQAGYEWQKNITGELVRLGYRQSPTDPLVFSRHTGKSWIIMCIHVDDFYVVASKPDLLNELYESLTKTYGSVSMVDGDLLSYLGMQVQVQTDGCIVVNQPGYAQQLCDMFLHKDKLKVSTPMVAMETSQESDQDPMDVTEYLKAVGGLNYLAINTRPDLLYSLSQVASKCAAPTKGDWRHVIRVITYVQSTIELGLRFNPGNIHVHGYVDASYNQYGDGKGSYGYCFMLGKSDAAFYSVSKRMKVQPLSSTEAEYVAFCEASRDVDYLHRLLKDIGFPVARPIVLYEDNKSCIDMLHGKSRHTASKHINPKFHYGRDQISKGLVEVRYVDTLHQVADLFTKALGNKIFAPLQKKLLNMS
jgi:hypothetical protein